jgi:hypothetical protein
MVAGRMLYHQGEFLSGDYHAAAGMAAASARSTRSAGHHASAAAQELKIALRAAYSGVEQP